MLRMTGGNSIAHLGKHGRDKAQSGAGEELGRIERGQEAGRGRSAGRRVGGVSRVVRLVVIASLFQKVKKVLARNEFQDEEKE